MKVIIVENYGTLQAMLPLPRGSSPRLLMVKIHVSFTIYSHRLNFKFIFSLRPKLEIEPETTLLTTFKFKYIKFKYLNNIAGSYQITGHGPDS